MRIIFLLLFFVGCAVNNVKYRMPSNRFNTPEVTGGSLFALDLNGRANLNYGSSNRVSVSDVIAPEVGVGDPAEKIIEDSSQLGLRLDLSMLDRLDLYWDFTLYSPSTVGLKWQFLGKTEQAFSQGWKSSLTAGFGSSSTGEREIPIREAEPPVFVKGTNETDVYDFYWMVGYRFPERLLLYLNLNYTIYENEITFGKGAQEKVVKAFETNTRGAIVGVQYYFKQKTSFLILEIGWSKGKIEGLAENTLTSAGVDFGWRFD